MIAGHVGAIIIMWMLVMWVQSWSCGCCPEVPPSFDSLGRWCASSAAAAARARSVASASWGRRPALPREGQQHWQEWHTPIITHF